RWTFSVKVIPKGIFAQEERLWEKPSGFTFWYNTDWSSYYRGHKFKTMERQTLALDQELGTRGPTPYGEFDASVTWSKLDEEEEVTGYTVGLTDGHISNLEGFNLRGFDFRSSFSPLSFPGQTLRGGFLQAPAFNNKLEYTLLHGREQQYFYSAVSPGLVSKQDAYIAGARLKIFPQAHNTFAVNYAHGYGQDRESYLEDNVFSVQSEHNFEKISVSTEVASDQDQIAANVSGVFRTPKLNVHLSLRDIEKDFTTISAQPPSIGEIGGAFGFDWYPMDRISLRSNFDLYRDRFLYNPEEPDKFNFTSDNSLHVTLSPTSQITSSLHYANAPGLYFPYRNLNALATYNKQFRLPFLDNRTLSTHIGYNYQRSINPLSPSADYKRDALLGGLRLQLLDDLHYYMNYTYSLVEELETGEQSHPSVMEAGLELYRQINPRLSSQLRLYYRNEESATTLHSFLSGEDSIESSVGLKFFPTKDIEFFVDGRLRKVWAERDELDDFIEADIRAGARIAWESFFMWAPHTRIEGAVFRDVNGDGIQDVDEEGIPDVEISIGPRRVHTDGEGEFSVRVRARSVKAKVDVDTVPRGYVFTTPVTAEIDTSEGGIKKIAFGLSSESGIYGVVFYDQDQDGELDREDLPISDVRVTIDDKISLRTNERGVYRFGNLKPGTHIVRIDVNTLPLQYLPTVSITKTVEVYEATTHTHHIPLKEK
ncbi:MAG: hypothetical protein JSW40_01650, partial [Candidatus Omnitrophota bacterium]